MANRSVFRGLKTSITRLVLMTLICLLIPAVHAQNTATTEDVKLAAEEKAGCSANLSRIYDAIQRYKADHKDLPNWLSDLVPQYIDDANIFVCPVCRRTGQAETSPLADPKLPCSYYFEFCPLPLGDAAPGNPAKTRREWKRRQMGLVGSVVPIVRCRHHNQVLNLAYDGHIYESGGSWETLLTNQINIAELTPVRIFPGGAKATVVPNSVRPPLNFPPRDAQASSNLINLTAFYNVMLTESWMGRPDNDLASLPSGVQKFGGVDYDVRGFIQLAGKGEVTKRFPKLVKDIPINLKCARLHFLHAAVFGNGVEDGTQVGSYMVHFTANQMQLEIPLYYGHDLRDWHTLSSEKPKPKDLTVVWTGTNTQSAAAHKSIRLFTTTWENVAPGVEIKSIDFISSLGPAVPFLIAITAE